jgi:histidinol-phosphate aminotransferase
MSPIRKSVEAMHGYVPGEQPKDPSIIKLNTNENPYPPSPEVIRVLQEGAHEKLRLYPDPVCTRLREAIAALHDCTPEQVLVGNGSDEVLALCTRAFVENDGSIGWFVPSYSLYPVLADIRDVETRPVDLGEGFEWSMPDEYHADLFFITNPNAPTAMMHDLQVVADFCEQFKGIVVLDEAYVDFADEHGMDLALSMPNVLVARTLSKSYSLAGIRCGYLVGPEDLIAALYKIKDSYNLNMLTQSAALAAIQDQAHMRANVARIRATRDRLIDALKARGWQLEASSANFVWAKPARPAPEVFERLRAAGIVVRYFPGPRTGDFIRITIGTDEAIDRLLMVV